MLCSITLFSLDLLMYATFATLNIVKIMRSANLPDSEKSQNVRGRNSSYATLLRYIAPLAKQVALINCHCNSTSDGRG